MLLTLLIFIVYALHNAQTREAKIQIEALELRNKVMQEMNDKLQEQAREYANNPQMVTRSLEAAFIAGANSRQAEIDD